MWPLLNREMGRAGQACWKYLSTDIHTTRTSHSVWYTVGVITFSLMERKPGSWWRIADVWETVHFAPVHSISQLHSLCSWPAPSPAWKTKETCLATVLWESTSRPGPFHSPCNALLVSLYAWPAVCSLHFKQNILTYFSVQIVSS